MFFQPKRATLWNQLYSQSIAEQTLPIWEYKVNCIKQNALLVVGSCLYYTIIRKVKQIFRQRAAKNYSEICPLTTPSPERARRKTERKIENIVACCLFWIKSEPILEKILTPNFSRWLAFGEPAKSQPKSAFGGQNSINFGKIFHK